VDAVLMSAGQQLIPERDEKCNANGNLMPLKIEEMGSSVGYLNIF